MHGGGLQKTSSSCAEGFKSQRGQFKIDPLSFYRQRVTKTLGGCNVIPAVEVRKQREAASCNRWKQQAASGWKPY